jgi:hypothetical protein
VEVDYVDDISEDHFASIKADVRNVRKYLVYVVTGDGSYHRNWSVSSRLRGNGAKE